MAVMPRTWIRGTGASPEADHEHGTPALAILHRHFSFHLGDEGGHHRQANAAARNAGVVLPAAEALEDQAPLLRRYSGTMVANAQLHHRRRG